MSVPVRPPIASPFVPRPGGLPPPPPGAVPPRPGLPAGPLPPPMPAPPPGMGLGAMPPMPPGMMGPMGGGMPPGMGGLSAPPPMPPMAPPQSPMPPPQPQQGTDPVQLLAALSQLVGTPIKERQPVYRPGFTPPAKPDPTKAIEAGRRLYDQALAWRVMIAKTLLWTRQDLTGSFPEDLYERELGFQEEYISPVLSADRNILISKGAALTPSFRSLYAKTDKAGYAQKLEDTVRWLRCMEELRHAETQRPLALDEWSLFTDYGMYAVRSTLA